MMRKSVAERLLDKSIPEPNSGCWLWDAPTNKDGYGAIKVNRKMSKAHRVSYATFVCEPADMFVLHKCDNPLCINPDHLFLGTHNDNMRDMAAKGRSVKHKRSGEMNPMFGREQSMKCKLIVQMNNIMRFNPYWGA